VPDKQPAVHILASGRNGTLYIGVTSALVQRIWQHREQAVEGFTQEHGVCMLVHYELFGAMEQAIVREKRLKKWNRLWKLRLIEERHPDWRDPWEEILGFRLRGNDAKNKAGQSPASSFRLRIGLHVHDRHGTRVQIRLHRLRAAFGAVA
jgi:putative endonuclease